MLSIDDDQDWRWHRQTIFVTFLMDKDPIFFLLFDGAGFFRSTPDYRQKLHRKWASRARRRAAVRRSSVKQWKTKSKDEMTEATTPATTTSAASTSTRRPPPAFAIRPIPGVKGDGSFAIRDIKQGEVLFEEDAALFITIAEVQAAVVEHGLAREEQEPVTPGNKSPVEQEFSSSQPPQDLHGAALIANERSCSRRPQSTPASSSSTERQQEAGLLQKIRVDPRRLVVERKFGELWNRDRLSQPVAVPPPSMRLPPPINLCCPASEAACFGGTTTTTTYEDVDGSKAIAYNSGCSRSSERILRMFDRTEVASSSAASSRRNRSPYGIFLTNAYDVPGMRGTGLYPLVGKGFNHSCRPNVGYDFVENTWRMRLFAARDIDKGQELCTCYCSLSVLLKGSAERQKFFAENNAFECGCEVCACEDGEDGDVVSRRVEKSDANRAEIAECLAAISGYEDIKSSSMRGVREAGRRKSRRKDAAVALTFIEEARKLLVEEKLLRQDLWIEYAELAFGAATACGDDKRRENYCEEVLNLLEVTGRKWTTAAGGGGLIESKKLQEYSQFRAEIKREQEEPSVASPASKSRPPTVV